MQSHQLFNSAWKKTPLLVHCNHNKPKVSIGTTIAPRCPVTHPTYLPLETPVTRSSKSNLTIERPQVKRKIELTKWMKRPQSKRCSAVNRKRRLLVEYLEVRTLLAAGIPPFVDINPIPYPSAPGAGGFVTVGDEIFFAAVTDANGAELWKTNGTDQGTVMVKDINPGPSGSTTGAPISIGGVIEIVPPYGSYSSMFMTPGYKQQ
jgi:ELWxxDGT repeat protein